MPLHLLYSHDLNFADTAAYRAEFPYDPPSDLSTSTTSATAFGATSGPDGGPGVYKTGGSGAFGFDVMALEPQGRLFKLKGRYKILSTGSSGTIMEASYIEPGNRASSFEGPLVRAVASTLGAITLSVKTTAGFANAGGNVYFQTLSGVFTPDTPFDFHIEGARSTIQETSPGVFAPDADGWVKAYVDGVEIASFSALPVWLNADTLGVNVAGYYWDAVTFKTNGAISDIEIWDEAPGMVGSLVAGVKTTVTATRAIAFGLDDNTNVHDIPGTFAVFGDQIITGTLTVGSTVLGGGGSIDVSGLLDALGT